ncbi:MAG: winged helix-turn-helix domain-containing protein, partial [Alphaproteobacteria bacterium]|nr:winged helix-turn-helix domain-containing protein [Alphaproteobacteria bacterium]
DPARANILVALMSGKALTASELAQEAGVTVQTASSHLKKLEEAELILPRKQGRHKYFSLYGEDVGFMLETLMGLAAKRGHLRSRTGPRDPALRHARVCYNHLAGEMGVMLFDALVSQEMIVEDKEEVNLTSAGFDFFESQGFMLSDIESPRRPLCRGCLDWSARRSHLGGALGSAILNRIYEKGWATRVKDSRVVSFSSKGKQDFLAAFGIAK